MKGKALLENEVWVRETSGKATKVKGVCAYKSLKLLGNKRIYMLDEKDEISNLNMKTAHFTNAITACPLKQHEVWR
eukprot:15156047-Ditylum_brightwellii.AAC.1